MCIVVRAPINTLLTQGKYTIECLKRIVGAMGGFGGRGAVDIEWNCFVNTKGEGKYYEEKI